MQQPLVLFRVENQHGVMAAQTERHQQGQPPAVAAACRYLDSGSILASQTSAHQATQGQLVLPLARFSPEQVLELLMGLDFQHSKSLRTAGPLIGSG